MIKKATSQQPMGMMKVKNRPTIIILKQIHQPQGPEAAVIPTGLCSDSEHRLQLMLIPPDHTHSQQTVAV